jgi:DNA-binding ferritin-like protein (Dps family)
VEPARVNAQLWFYALAACRALGLHAAIVRIVYTQSGRCDEYEIDALELAGFAQDLARLARQVDERRAAGARGELLDTREGAWCKHCASKHVCPSKNGLLVQIAEQGTALAGDAAMTQERARALYGFLDRVKTLVKEADKRIAAYVTEQGPIDLGDGRMFGRYVTMGNERVNGPITVQAIHEVCGEHAAAFADAAITASTSKAAITRAAKQVGQPGLAKMVIARSRELGGVANEQKMPIGEYLATEHAPAKLGAVDLGELNRALAEATP